MVKKVNKHHLKDNDGDFTVLPAIDRDLVEALDFIFPEQSADLQWSEREVWHKSGQRSVIKYLQQQLKEQEENII